jgi:hypothetical protein
MFINNYKIQFYFVSYINITILKSPFKMKYNIYPVSYICVLYFLQGVYYLYLLNAVMVIIKISIPSYLNWNGNLNLYNIEKEILLIINAFINHIIIYDYIILFINNAL